LAALGKVIHGALVVACQLQRANPVTVMVLGAAEASELMVMVWLAGGEKV